MVTKFAYSDHRCAQALDKLLFPLRLRRNLAMADFRAIPTTTMTTIQDGVLVAILITQHAIVNAISAAATTTTTTIAAGYVQVSACTVVKDSSLFQFRVTGCHHRHRPLNCRPFHQFSRPFPYSRRHILTRLLCLNNNFPYAERRSDAPVTCFISLQPKTQTFFCARRKFMN